MPRSSGRRIECGERLPDHRAGEIAFTGSDDGEHDQQLPPGAARGGRVLARAGGPPALPGRRAAPRVRGRRPATRLRPPSGTRSGSGPRGVRRPGGGWRALRAGGPNRLPGGARLHRAEVAHVVLPVDGGGRPAHRVLRVQQRQEVEVDQGLAIRAASRTARPGATRLRRIGFAGPRRRGRPRPTGALRARRARLPGRRPGPLPLAGGEEPLPPPGAPAALARDPVDDRGRHHQQPDDRQQGADLVHVSPPPSRGPGRRPPIRDATPRARSWSPR